MTEHRSFFVLSAIQKADDHKKYHDFQKKIVIYDNEKN